MAAGGLTVSPPSPRWTDADGVQVMFRRTTTQGITQMWGGVALMRNQTAMLTPRLAPKS